MYVQGNLRLPYAKDLLKSYNEHSDNPRFKNRISASSVIVCIVFKFAHFKVGNSLIHNRIFVLTIGRN